MNSDPDGRIKAAFYEGARAVRSVPPGDEWSLETHFEMWMSLFEAQPLPMLEDLDLSTRAYNCLRRAGVVTVEQLALCRRGWLETIPKLGAKSLGEIEDALLDLGLKLT